MDANELLTNPELQPVIATVDHYFQGLYHGDKSRLREAFSSGPAKNGEPFEMQIESVDLIGQVGSVKVKNLYQGLRYTAYLNIAKTGGRWKIVNKTFHHD
jgi:protease I